MNRADVIFPYYSIGDFINQPNNPTQFEITRFEHMSEPEVDDIHKHTFYEILWVDEGESRQFIDFHEFDLRAGSLFFIAPDKHTIYFENMPSYITKVRDYSAADQLYDVLQNRNNITVVDLREDLVSNKEKSQLYFKVDTHWNYHGANIVQYKIAKALASSADDEAFECGVL